MRHQIYSAWEIGELTSREKDMLLCVETALEWIDSTHNPVYRQVLMKACLVGIERMLNAKPLP